MNKEPIIEPNSIPDYLWDKYETRGPRYTSYPTAPHMSQIFDRQQIISRWRESNTSNEKGLSLYFHIPFCSSRCYYCGCYTNVHQSKEQANHYIQAVIDETRLLAQIINPERPVKQLAFGGGTPNYLSQKTLTLLIKELKTIFQLDPLIEQSIELDPRSLTTDYLKLLLSLGFNRYSFGVQDLDETVQANIGRKLKLEHLFGLIDFLKTNSIKNINIDLIYGLPGQTERTFEKTIDKIILLKPARLAIFGYAHLPHIHSHQKILERNPIPSSKEKIKLFSSAFHRLIKVGYKPIGMDHFALESDDLYKAQLQHSLNRNFMGYTTHRGLDLLGIGASSISSVNHTYTQNIKSVKDYQNNSEKIRWWKGLILSNEDVLRREIILNLFCNYHLDKLEIEKKFNIHFQTHFSKELKNLIPFEKDGLIHMDKNIFDVTPMGKFFIRNICMVFDEYLRKAPHNITYSKTI